MVSRRVGGRGPRSRLEKRRPRPIGRRSAVALSKLLLFDRSLPGAPSNSTRLSACPRTRSVETVQLIVLCCASCPTNLQPGSFHKPAIVRLAASKSLAQFDISPAALRLQPTNPWLLGDSSVYFRSWKSGLSRLRSGETEPCARRCAFNQIGEIDRGDFFYLNRP